MGRSETVTVLMNDIVASTALRVELGDDRADALFADLVGRWRTCLLDHDGREIKGMGDGLMAVFRSANDAVACGIAMQHAVCVMSNARGMSIAMRVGLSAGEAAEEEGDWHGTPVVEAARLCSAADAGQVLVSDVVRALVGSRGGHHFDDGVDLDLKGLPEPVRAFAARWDPPAATRAALPAALEVAGRGVFVGRVDAIALLDGAAARSRSAGRQMVLISGEPGQGKTRLAAEMAGRAAARGARVLFGRCDEDLQRAYRPWVEITAALIAALPDEALDQHLDAFGGSVARLGSAIHRRRPDAPPPAPLDAEAEPLVLADVLVDLMARAAQEATVMIVLDDLHWADRPSLLLLKAVLQASVAVPLVIVGTYRDTDLDRTHALASLLGDLRREPGVERLALAGLDAGAVAELVDALAGQDVAAAEADLVRVLHAETGGNPLFLGEVLRYFVETGALVRHDGEWQRAGTGDLDVPEGLKEVVGHRLDRLSPLTNEALQVAAVVGASFDLATVESVLDVDADTLIEALEAAARSGVVDEVARGGDRFQFRHAVLRTVIEGELSSVRRALLHRKVGDALERRYAAVVDEHLDELAFHRVEAARAGDANEAARWCVRAAERALEEVRFADALAAVERGWQVLDLADAPDPGVRCDLAIAGQWSTFWFPGDAMFRWHERAIPTARELGDPVRLARAACWLLPQIDAMDPLLAEMADALARLPADERVLHRLLLGCYVTCLASAGAPIDVVGPLADEQLTLARELGDHGALFDALYAKLVSLDGQPNLAERRALFAELTSMNNVVGMYAGMSADGQGGMLALSAGDRRGFEAHLANLTATAAREHSDYKTAMVAQWEATLALLDGRFDEVEQLSVRQVEAAGLSSDFPLAYFGQLVVQQTITGRGDESLAMIDAVMADHPNFPVLLVTKAAVCAAVGQTTAARELVDQLAPDDFRVLGRGFLWPLSLARLVDAVAETGAREYAETLVAMVEPWAGQTFIAGAGLDVLGAVNRYVGMLQAMLGRFAEIDERFASAVALEERLEAPPLAAVSRYWWARALLARGADGDVERATDLLAQCRETADALGMRLQAEKAAQASAGIGTV